MRIFLKIFFWTILSLLVTIIGLALRGTEFNFFSTPQLVLAFWIPIVVLSTNQKTVFLSLPSILIYDFYATTPFGAYSIALIIGIYTAHAMFKTIFTNITPLTIFFGTFIGTLASRIAIYIFLFFLFLLKRYPLVFSYSDAVYIAQEILSTGLISLIPYTLYRYSSQKNSVYHRDGI